MNRQDSPATADFPSAASERHTQRYGARWPACFSIQPAAVAVFTVAFLPDGGHAGWQRADTILADMNRPGSRPAK